MKNLLLTAPRSYVEATPAMRAEICNGCGTKGLLGKLVPETCWGMKIEEACNIHDWMYYWGKNLEDKKQADRCFKNNILRLIDFKTEWPLLKWLRYKRAETYYQAVKKFGGPAFWHGKYQTTLNYQVLEDTI